MFSAWRRRRDIFNDWKIRVRFPETTEMFLFLRSSLSTTSSTKRRMYFCEVESHWEGNYLGKGSLYLNYFCEDYKNMYDILYISTLHHKWLLCIPPALFCIFQPYITSGYYTFHQLYFVYFNLTSQVVLIHSTSSILYISTLHHKWLLCIPPALRFIPQDVLTCLLLELPSSVVTPFSAESKFKFGYFW
jgi:hypothetical protein